MTIAYVLPEFLTEKTAGGLARYYDNISRLLSDAGHKIYIFVLSDKTEKVFYYPGIIVERVYVDLRNINAQIPGTFIRERSRIFSTKLLKYIEDGVQFDIVQYPNLWATGLIRIHIPTVVRISSYQPLLRAADQETFEVDRTYKGVKASDYLEEIAMLRADAVYGPSSCIADIISNNSGIKIKVIESPFYPCSAVEGNKNFYEENLKNKKYILTFGTLKILKGAKLIGDSIHQILNECTDLMWVFAGDEFPWKNGSGESVSPKEYIKTHAAECADRILFLGKLNPEDLFPVIKHALFCVLPSRIDNLPNTCIEAMALGKVVIGTRGASFEQLIVHGKNGFLIERENKDMLIETIRSVYALTEKEKKEIGRMAKKRIERMRPEKIRNELLTFYSDVIKAFCGVKRIDKYLQSVIDKYNNEIRSIAGNESNEYELRF